MQKSGFVVMKSLPLGGSTREFKVESNSQLGTGGYSWFRHHEVTLGSKTRKTKWNGKSAWSMTKNCRGIFLVLSSAALLHSLHLKRFVITCMHMHDRSDLVTSPAALRYKLYVSLKWWGRICSSVPSLSLVLKPTGRWNRVPYIRLEFSILWVAWSWEHSSHVMSKGNASRWVYSPVELRGEEWLVKRKNWRRVSFGVLRKKGPKHGYTRHAPATQVAYLLNLRFFKHLNFKKSLHHQAC